LPCFRFCHRAWPHSLHAKMKPRRGRLDGFCEVGCPAFVTNRQSRGEAQLRAAIRASSVQRRLMPLALAPRLTCARRPLRISDLRHGSCGSAIGRKIGPVCGCVGTRRRQVRGETRTLTPPQASLHQPRSKHRGGCSERSADSSSNRQADRAMQLKVG
jgi:hypothetical protein